MGYPSAHIRLVDNEGRLIEQAGIERYSPSGFQHPIFLASGAATVDMAAGPLTSCQRVDGARDSYPLCEKAQEGQCTPFTCQDQYNFQKCNSFPIRQGELQYCWGVCGCNGARAAEALVLSQVDDGCCKS